MIIATENPATSDIAALLQAHLLDMGAHSPPESVHALDLAALQAPDMTFFSARRANATNTSEGRGELLGCAALKQLTADAGELKSMRTVIAHLRQGVAATLLEHIINVATNKGMRNLSLETGTPDAFLPARELYKRHGFVICEPFADYTHDPYSVCMQLRLSTSTGGG